MDRRVEVLERLRLESVMVSPAHSLAEHHTVGEAARMMADLRIGTIPVVDGPGRPVGIVSVIDFLRLLAG